MLEQIKDLVIFEAISGSHAYGLATADSDIDKRGIFIAPTEYNVSCYKKVEQVEVPNEDTVYYELRKFLKLAGECNPNIIELLFMPADCVKFCSPAMYKIIAHRDLFLSKKARHTFSGYAYAQLKRIVGHKKWIANPQPKDPPKISNYCKMIDDEGLVIKDVDIISDLSQDTFLVNTFQSAEKQILRIFRSDLFFKEKLGWFDRTNTNIKCIDIDDRILLEKAVYCGILIINFKEYKSDLDKWKHYWDWKNNRNEKRAALEEKVGYDSKHAMHLVRLFRCCEEILTQGHINVRRPDAEELLSIKNGSWSYDKLLEYADHMDKTMEKLYETSKLRFSADYEGIDILYRSLVIPSIKEIV